MRQIDPLWWVAATLLLGGALGVGIYMYVQGAVQERQREARIEVERQAPAAPVAGATVVLDDPVKAASAFVADVSARRFAAAHARMAGVAPARDNPGR